MAFDAEAHTLVLPFSRRNSEDSVASSLSDAETELMQAPPWSGDVHDAMAPASSLQLYNLRRLLLGLDSPLGADNESEEGVEDNRSAQSDYSSDGEDEGHGWTDSWTMSTASTDHDVVHVADVRQAVLGLHEGHDASLTNQGAVIWI